MHRLGVEQPYTLEGIVTSVGGQTQTEARKMKREFTIGNEPVLSEIKDLPITSFSLSSCLSTDTSVNATRRISLLFHSLSFPP